MSSSDSLSLAVPFRPLLLSHDNEPDSELFRYAASIRSMFGLGRTLVAVTPSRNDPGVLVTMARQALEFPESGRVAFRLLFDADPATLFQAAEEEGAELVVAPSPRERWAGSVEQLAFESRHPVCFVPRRFRQRPLRAMVRVEFTQAGASLLETAAAACRAGGVESLVVAHLFSHNTLDPDPRSVELPRRELTRDLYRLIESAGAPGVACIPVVEETLHPVAAALRIARQYAPDVVFDSFSWPGIQTSWSRREARLYLRNIGVPLVHLPSLREPPSGWRILKSRIFTEREPTFG